MTAGSISVPSIIPLRPPELGKPKHIVDSNTRIEIKSESAGVNIYYTMNGSKPEPFATLGTDHSTFKYRGPFTLPEGKQTVKAMATSKDGVRESNINTKVFEVEYIQPNIHFTQEDDDKAFQADLIKEKNRQAMTRSTRRAWNDSAGALEASMTDMRVSGSDRRVPPSGARFTANRFQHNGTRSFDDSGMMDIESKKMTAPDPYRQTLKLQKETDFLRCVYCYADRPSDLYARYCQNCGNPVPPIPNTRLSAPQPGEMGTCIYCKSLVPQNTSTCVVCEASIPGQNKPQMSLKLAETKVCRYCGTGNPPTLASCILCEATLPSHTRPVGSSDSAPPIQYGTGQQRECSKCRRVNNPDARYCDWCGTKPAPQGIPLTCSKCGAANNLYAAFCASCGVGIAAPDRQDSNKTLMNSGSKTFWSPVSARSVQFEKPISTPLPSSSRRISSTAVSTQTVGLFYPSERELQKKREEEKDKYAMEKQMRDRKPLLTNVSPGRGYWRKQMEHITTHLKAEAQNNTEFRALIGEPRMGKLTSVAVHEDGFELTLTASFALRGQKDTYKGPVMAGSKVLSDLTRRYRRFDSDASEESDERDSIVASEFSEVLSTTNQKKKPKKKRAAKKESQLSLEEKKLIREIGKNGQGRGDEVRELLTEGASPNIMSAQGTPAIVMATTNKHIDCLLALHEAGADVDAQDKSGNTALHEAVILGYPGKEIMDMLLSLGASLNVKNNRGQTPHDLALSTGNDTASKAFMSSMGHSQLSRMSKPRASKSGKVNIF